MHIFSEHRKFIPSMKTTMLVSRKVALSVSPSHISCSYCSTLFYSKNWMIIPSTNIREPEKYFREAKLLHLCFEQLPQTFSFPSVPWVLHYKVSGHSWLQYNSIFTLHVGISWLIPTLFLWKKPFPSLQVSGSCDFLKTASNSFCMILKVFTFSDSLSRVSFT